MDLYDFIVRLNINIKAKNRIKSNYINYVTWSLVTPLALMEGCTCLLLCLALNIKSLRVILVLKRRGSYLIQRVILISLPAANTNYKMFYNRSTNCAGFWAIQLMSSKLSGPSMQLKQSIIFLIQGSQHITIKGRDLSKS